MKIFYWILLVLNMIVIIIQRLIIDELEEDLHQARIDAINELNKLRNGENENVK